jgi:hypothetical protein
VVETLRDDEMRLIARRLTEILAPAREAVAR